MTQHGHIFGLIPCYIPWGSDVQCLNTGKGHWHLVELDFSNTSCQISCAEILLIETTAATAAIYRDPLHSKDQPPQVPRWQTHETPWAGRHQPGLAAWATARRTWWTRCSKVHPETGGGSSGATPAAQGWEWWWTLTPEHLLVFSCLGCYCDREAKNPRSIPAGRVYVVA